ncbi:calcineurin-like phosphoesterase C-terminal domain-containing protein [bacterium]|nr:calcineurin-like phosphoesterase C-terminal domain-containing protein [bacterium]
MAARQRGGGPATDGNGLSRRAFLRESALVPAGVALGQAYTASAGRHRQVYNWKRWGASARGGTQECPAVAGRVVCGDRPLAVTRRENAEAVIAVLSRHNVPLVLQGHEHENERIFREGIEVVASVSVCGSWWKTKSGRQLGVSGEPRGYRLLDVDGTRVKHRYVSSAESQTDDAGEFVGMGEMPLKAGDEPVVDFFDASNEAAVSGRVDGGAWQPWIRAKESRYRLVTHHWRSPKGFLAAGKRRVEVRCRDREREDTTVAATLAIS